jgi:hypothetical protein
MPHPAAVGAGTVGVAAGAIGYLYGDRYERDSRRPKVSVSWEHGEVNELVGDHVFREVKHQRGFYGEREARVKVGGKPLPNISKGKNTYWQNKKKSFERSKDGWARTSYEPNRKFQHKMFKPVHGKPRVRMKKTPVRRRQRRLDDRAFEARAEMSEYWEPVYGKVY